MKTIARFQIIFDLALDKCKSYRQNIGAGNFNLEGGE